MPRVERRLNMDPRVHSPLYVEREGRANTSGEGIQKGARPLPAFPRRMPEPEPEREHGHGAQPEPRR